MSKYFLKKKKTSQAQKKLAHTKKGSGHICLCAIKLTINKTFKINEKTKLIQNLFTKYITHYSKLKNCGQKSDCLKRAKLLLLETSTKASITTNIFYNFLFITYMKKVFWKRNVYIYPHTLNMMTKHHTLCIPVIKLG